jgi:hypothetical protein
VGLSRCLGTTSRYEKARMGSKRSFGGGLWPRVSIGTIREFHFDVRAQGPGRGERLEPMAKQQQLSATRAAHRRRRRGRPQLCRRWAVAVHAACCRRAGARAGRRVSRPAAPPQTPRGIAPGSAPRQRQTDAPVHRLAGKSQVTEMACSVLESSPESLSLTSATRNVAR